MSMCDSCSKQKDCWNKKYCEKYKRNMEQTNEEWLRKARTEDIARFLVKELIGTHYLASVHGIKKQDQENNLIVWLRRKHDDER